MAWLKTTTLLVCLLSLAFMKKLLILFLVFTLFSCQKTEKKEERHKPVRPKRSAKMFSGSPDLPADEKQITSAGIGKIILGDPLSAVEQHYDSIISLTLYKEGRAWPAKKIMLNDQEWIIAESVNSVNQITAIFTNAESFRTKEGYRIGMPLDSIVHPEDSLRIDPQQKALFIPGSGIGIKVKEEEEKAFFKNPKPGSFKKNITIEEFFIICGDC